MTNREYDGTSPLPDSDLLYGDQTTENTSAVLSAATVAVLSAPICAVLSPEIASVPTAAICVGLNEPICAATSPAVSPGIAAVLSAPICAEPNLPTAAVASAATWPELSTATWVEVSPTTLAVLSAESSSRVNALACAADSAATWPELSTATWVEVRPSDTCAEAAVDTNDTVVNTAETVAKQPRRRWSYADDYMTVNLGEPTGDTVTSLVFDMGTLPEKAYAHLAAFAVTILCGRVDDPAAEFARLVTGVAAERKPKSEPKPKVDFWRQAIALAFVDSTKKAPAGQMTIETATEKAKAIGKERLRELKLDPVVVKHFNKLTGGTKGYSVAALLADEATAEAA